MAFVEFLGHAFDENNIMMSSAMIVVIRDLQDRTRL